MRSDFRAKQSQPSTSLNESEEIYDCINTMTGDIMCGDKVHAKKIDEHGNVCDLINSKLRKIDSLDAILIYV